MVKTEQGPGYGAVILAMVGCGLYKDIKTACDSLIETSSVVYPDSEISALYNEKYQQFKKLYPSLKEFFNNK